MTSVKQPLIILTGPTAVGKTALSIELAKAVGGEIISADSMQVYRHMDIGSAKVTKEEMEGIPHYLIDVLDPQDDFNVVTFQTMAKQAMNEIYSHNKVPIITGGTGFYIQALLYDIDFKENDEKNPVREELEQLAEKLGENAPQVLHQKLQEVDPEAAAQIHANNIKRVIRAIEYFKQTGEKISQHNEEMHQKDSPYNFLYYVLTRDRKVLYERIDRRVDIMMENGLVDEVKKLKDMGCHRGQTSMQGLGYKEILGWWLHVRRSRIYPETGYQTFCQAAAYMVSQGKGCALAGLRPVSGKYRPYPCRYIKGLRTGRNRAKIANRKKSNLIKIGVIT